MRDLADVETLEGLAIRIALVQYRAPAQARLRAFEHEEFEQPRIVVQRHAPLGVVVVAHACVVAAGPGTTRQGFRHRHSRRVGLFESV